MSLTGLTGLWDLTIYPSAPLSAAVLLPLTALRQLRRLHVAGSPEQLEGVDDADDVGVTLWDQASLLLECSQLDGCVCHNQDWSGGYPIHCAYRLESIANIIV